jgi:hypothetical protein
VSVVVEVDDAVAMLPNGLVTELLRLREMDAGNRRQALQAVVKRNRLAFTSQERGQGMGPGCL